jgi:hypothetical protein
MSVEVLEGLRRAQRVSLAVKDNRTAVLGYWVDEELNVALLESGPFLLHVPRAAPNDVVVGSGPFTHKFSLRGTPRPRPGVVFDTSTAAADSFWSRLLGVVREGDVIRLGDDHDNPGLVLLHVYANKSRVASIRVPRKRPAQSVA